MNNEIVALSWLKRHTEALQRTSRFTTVLVFIPPKNHDYSFEFHPIKTALRAQGTTPILRVVPFQDLWWHVWRSSHQMKHRAIALAPQKKEIIIILLICLRHDERHKAEDWIRCRRSCSFPGTNPDTVCNVFKNVHLSFSLPLCFWISVCFNHLFVYKEGILLCVLMQWNQQDSVDVSSNVNKPCKVHKPPLAAISKCLLLSRWSLTMCNEQKRQRSLDKMKQNTVWVHKNAKSNKYDAHLKY